MDYDKRLVRGLFLTLGKYDLTHSRERPIVRDKPVDGFCDYDDKRIVIFTSCSTSNLLNTTIHELIHAYSEENLLGWDERKVKSETSKLIRELRRNELE
jgi:hypothetical protein